MTTTPDAQGYAETAAMLTADLFMGGLFADLWEDDEKRDAITDEANGFAGLMGYVAEIAMHLEDIVAQFEQGWEAFDWYQTSELVAQMIGEACAAEDVKLPYAGYIATRALLQRYQANGNPRCPVNIGRILMPRPEDAYRTVAGIGTLITGWRVDINGHVEEGWPSEPGAFVGLYFTPRPKIGHHAERVHLGDFPDWARAHEAATMIIKALEKSRS